MIWNSRLHSLRLSKHFTLKEVASRVGLSEAMVSRHETSTQSIPYNIIEAYAKIYSCSPSYIMGWSDSFASSCDSDASDLSLSPLERQVVLSFRACSPERQDIILELLSIKKSPEEDSSSSSKKEA